MDLSDIKTCLVKEKQHFQNIILNPSVFLVLLFVANSEAKVTSTILVDFENDDMDLFTFIELKIICLAGLAEKWIW